jgi:hypothetical protein
MASVKGPAGVSMVVLAQSLTTADFLGDFSLWKPKMGYGCEAIRRQAGLRERDDATNPVPALSRSDTPGTIPAKYTGFTTISSSFVDRRAAINEDGRSTG